MARTTSRARPAAKGEKSAQLGDASIVRGEGGETHQVAGGDVPVLTTQQGVPVADDQNSLRIGRRGPTALEDFPFPRENLSFRPRAHSRARRACPRLRRARLFRELWIARRHHPRRSVPARRAKRRRSSSASRPWRAARARPTWRATCAASRSSFIRRKATGTSSATTSRCSSFRTRSSFPIWSMPPRKSRTAPFRRRRPRTTISGTSFR